MAISSLPYNLIQGWRSRYPFALNQGSRVQNMRFSYNGGAMRRFLIESLAHHQSWKPGRW
jgi:hypothetical protein